MKKNILLCCVFFVLIIAGNVFADTLYLKNGNQVTGTMIMQDDEKVLFRIGEGQDAVEITFFKDEISRIEKQEIPNFVTPPSAEEKTQPLPLAQPVAKEQAPVEKTAEVATSAQTDKQDNAVTSESLYTMTPIEKATLVTPPPQATALEQEIAPKPLTEVPAQKIQPPEKQPEILPQKTNQAAVPPESSLVAELVTLLNKEEIDYFTNITSLVKDSMTKTMSLAANPDKFMQEPDKLPQAIIDMSSELDSVIRQLSNSSVPEQFVRFHKIYLNNLILMKGILTDISKGDITNAQAKIADLNSANGTIQSELEAILAAKKNKQQ
ncbi:MAG: hypothetical protein PHS93_00535 [Candidatus Omnitrophica bacterium]|nr:hypothetical protein [Candidatus Omnitrophota bacterium]MDD5351640.1 hypothetical protein [Candidatus Omnitrophota bacterium]MDD5550850.1 hypothetical protein [Candidatus Omnitrophota bacterium]